MEKSRMVEGANGTMRYQGVMQWPMTIEQQKAAGLIARVNQSIRPPKEEAE